MPVVRPAALLLLAAVPLLAACSYRAPGPEGPVSEIGIGPGAANYHFSGAPFGRPAGCAGSIDQFRQVIENDRKTDHLEAAVYRRVTADLERVSAACAAGREADAGAQLAAVRARYGYR
jgi:hypothetical protein